MSDPWYSEGLRFSCTGCAGCCTGEPGAIWVNEKEAAKLASFLGVTVQEFLRQYTVDYEGRSSLREVERVPGQHDCIFLEGKSCRVYSARPTQCRTFPFWPRNLRSEEAWKECASECEGISSEGELISVETILQRLREQERAGPLH